MESAYRILNCLENLLAKIAAITIFVMMFLIFVDVMSRWLFNSPIAGIMELNGEYLMPIVVYFMISYTHRYGGHVFVDILYNKFSNIMKRAASLLTNLLALSVFIVLGISNFQEGLEHFVKGTQSVGLLEYPLAPAIMMITLGICVLVIRIVLDLFGLLRGHPVNENIHQDTSF